MSASCRPPMSSRDCTRRYAALRLGAYATTMPPALLCSSSAEPGAVVDCFPVRGASTANSLPMHEAHGENADRDRLWLTLWQVRDNRASGCSIFGTRCPLRMPSVFTGASKTSRECADASGQAGCGPAQALAKAVCWRCGSIRTARGFRRPPWRCRCGAAAIRFGSGPSRPEGARGSAARRRRHA